MTLHNIGYGLYSSKMQFAGGLQFSTPIYNWKIIFFQRNEEKKKFHVLPARMEPVAEQNTISHGLLLCFEKLKVVQP